MFISPTLMKVLFIEFLRQRMKFELFVKPAWMSYPNGIALSGRRNEFVCCASCKEFQLLILQAREVNLLTAPESTATTSIDGMVFYENSLIANQALTGVERVARFYLSSDPSSYRKTGSVADQSSDVCNAHYRSSGRRQFLLHCEQSAPQL